MDTKGIGRVVAATGRVVVVTFGNRGEARLD
jgi:hypothetical protein